MSTHLETLTFDGLGASETAVPKGYGGLRWGNVDVYQPTPGEHDGYSNDLRSGDSVAYNGAGSTATIASGGAFNLDSGHFAAALESNVTVTFTAYHRGVEVGEVTKVLDEHSHRIKFPHSFHHITEVTITTENPVNPTITQLAMEDLVVRVKTPHKTHADTDLQHHDVSHAFDPMSSMDLHHSGSDFVV